MARLASIVHVTDEKGQSIAFGPDDEVPAWAASKITNPKAWETPPEQEDTSHVSALASPPATAPPVKRATSRRKAAQDAAVHGN
jgi:hypothetical protein